MKQSFDFCRSSASAPVFVSDGVRYEYRVAATPERVIRQSLRAFPAAKKQLWFCRDWQQETQIYMWTAEEPTGCRRDRTQERFTLSNVLCLSKAISLGDSQHSQLEPVFWWFKEQVRFVG